MEMRKFVIEIHPDGTLTCREYEDPKESFRAYVPGCRIRRYVVLSAYRKYLNTKK